MKKRAFVRYSKQGKIVPGSLILTSGSHPNGPSTWKEVPADLCCDNPIEVLSNGLGDTNITNLSVRIKCSGTTLYTLYTNQSSTDEVNLIGILSNVLGPLGTLSITTNQASDYIVVLTMTETQKNELCPTGTLSLEVFSD